ncbi:hypothetical protein BpHYR1_003921 [Brachionus plicatilis]|uniref:Uncharacterized protein n=1 Tax=Brachionus plicatilis TaxID=10195 RepID=A0A3M7RFB4_BRAPC|nr:hypothetical protein BpHYR1_003921 [Brachionus plicatilis]
MEAFHNAFGNMLIRRPSVYTLEDMFRRFFFNSTFFSRIKFLRVQEKRRKLLCSNYTMELDIRYILIRNLLYIHTPFLRLVGQIDSILP